MQTLDKTERSRVGLTPNGRIDWHCRANKICLALLRRGSFYYGAISRITKLTPGQISLRAKKKNLQVSAYRRGESDSAKIYLKRYKIVRGFNGNNETE